mmetsp:Transcript_14596/g.61568  ORF Transcript_14596/g.61568 Transcript_14596/m.61568 type:complete len:248 (-) Transcript_14596:201-944(-)
MTLRLGCQSSAVTATRGDTCVSTRAITFASTRSHIVTTPSSPAATTCASSCVSRADTFECLHARPRYSAKSSPCSISKSARRSFTVPTKAQAPSPENATETTGLSVPKSSLRATPARTSNVFAVPSTEPARIFVSDTATDVTASLNVSFSFSLRSPPMPPMTCIASRLAERASKKRTVRSNPALTTTESFSPANATAFTPPSCPLNRRSLEPDVTSHKNTSLSPPHVARRLLSAAASTSRTSRGCPA